LFNIVVVVGMLGACVCLWIGEYVWEPIGRVSRMVMRVSGHIMKDTGTELRSETLQNEADCITVTEDLVQNAVRTLDCDKRDNHRNS
jgi:hypothetical protein